MAANVVSSSIVLVERLSLKVRALIWGYRAQQYKESDPASARFAEDLATGASTQPAGMVREEGAAFEGYFAIPWGVSVTWDDVPPIPRLLYIRMPWPITV